MRKVMWTAALMLGLTTMACGQGRADTSALEGKAAPEIALKTFDGKDVKLSEMKGKVVLVDMWATWCGPCRKSLPHVQELSANKELAEKGLVVWAVNSQESKTKVGDFLEENNYTFTVPMDTKGQVGTDYLVGGIPTTVVVGRDGVIKKVFVGLRPDTGKKVDAAIEAALAEKAEAGTQPGETEKK